MKGRTTAARQRARFLLRTGYLKVGERILTDNIKTCLVLKILFHGAVYNCDFPNFVFFVTYFI